MDEQKHKLAIKKKGPCLDMLQLCPVHLSHRPSRLAQNDPRRCREHCHIYSRRGSSIYAQSVLPSEHERDQRPFSSPWHPKCVVEMTVEGRILGSTCEPNVKMSIKNIWR